jgi:hypothetical protein
VPYLFFVAFFFFFFVVVILVVVIIVASLCSFSFSAIPVLVCSSFSSYSLRIRGTIGGGLAHFTGARSFLDRVR